MLEVVKGISTQKAGTYGSNESGRPHARWDTGAILYINAADFVCASGAMLSQGLFSNLLGKLCLTRTSLVMLPYEGVALEIVKKLAEHLRKAILGPYADMAEKLEHFGLYVKGPEVLDKVLVWPLAHLQGEARVVEHLLGGADLIIQLHGETYRFNLKAKGHEKAGFASAQTFRDHINRLRPR